eukprot:scaffold108671_cov27-Tisochrysis_lutea.AAC.2
MDKSQFAACYEHRWPQGLMLSAGTTWHIRHSCAHVQSRKLGDNRSTAWLPHWQGIGRAPAASLSIKPAIFLIALPVACEEYSLVRIDCNL